MLGLVLFVVLMAFIIFSCVSARRRRKMGFAPYRGTGWAGGRNNNAQPQYNNSQPYYNNTSQQQPAPAYNAAPAATHNGGAAQDYYGNGGVQQPMQTYNRGHEEYKPPTGPPPTH